MKRAAFWFSVSVIASVILFYVWEWLRFEADVTPNEVVRRPDWVDPSHSIAVPMGDDRRVWMTPEQARRLGFTDRPITSFDLPAYRRAGLI